MANDKLNKISSGDHLKQRSFTENECSRNNIPTVTLRSTFKWWIVRHKRNKNTKITVTFPENYTTQKN